MPAIVKKSFVCRKNHMLFISKKKSCRFAGDVFPMSCLIYIILAVFRKVSSNFFPTPVVRENRGEILKLEFTVMI